MISWPGWVRWAASVLLISWVVSFVVAACLSVVGLYEVDSNPFAGAAIFVVSIVGAILLRRHWSSIRSWNSTAEDWMFDHPAATIGTYALMGMLFSLGLGLSLVNLAFGGSLWGLAGWLYLRRDRRLRGGATT